MPRGWWEAVPGGLAFQRSEGRLVSDAFPLPAARPLGRAAMVLDPRPVFPGRGWCGCGDPAPAPQRVPLRALVTRRRGGGGRASQGGVPCAAVGFTCSYSPGCLSCGRTVEVRYPRAVGTGVGAWRSSTVPLACMPCGGLHAAGVVGGRPGGVALHRCEGRLVSGAVPPPAARILGRAAGVPRPVVPGRGWRGRGEPAPAPQRALLRAVVAYCGGGGGVPGGPRGGALRRCEGRLSSGTLRPPSARPRGGLSGSATHVLWMRVCGCGGPALSLWLARRGGGCVPRGWREVVPGGLAFHRCEGRLVSGAVPPPAARSLGRAAGVPRPSVPGRGWCGRGDSPAAPQRALL